MGDQSSGQFARRGHQKPILIKMNIMNIWDMVKAEANTHVADENRWSRMAPIPTIKK